MHLHQALTTMLQFSALIDNLKHASTPHSSAQHSTARHGAAHHNTVQHSITHCIASQAPHSTGVHTRGLPHDAKLGQASMPYHWRPHATRSSLNFTHASPSQLGSSSSKASCPSGSCPPAVHVHVGPVFTTLTPRHTPEGCISQASGLGGRDVASPWPCCASANALAAASSPARVMAPVTFLFRV